ncbi:pentapeptide repeat-containing protein [Clostridium lundense]|uniref:pentapeptide repeat-containing protein n=1 Tax=Clostridium lundense TaxID=319475 RepID=UPI000481EBEE|nr:pentapeptide repeat-containing protein [Clostridium lundense]
MTYENTIKYDKELHKNLKIHCEKCLGFCCVALYFSASEGFPTDKDAGKPCINLQPDFKCAVHKNLRQKGLKGCTAYDCFGAGQKVAQVTYGGQDWIKNTETSKQMFDVFLIMRQLHEMLWYLAEAFRMQYDETIQEKIRDMIDETVRLTNLDADSLIKLDLVVHRHNVNKLLLKTSELARGKARGGKKATLKHRKTIAGRLNFIGADLRKVNLIGEDLSGALLIAANLRDVDLSGTDLIGADLRDADISGANLTNSIFITQVQINAAKGNSNTRLPISLVRPAHWDK